MTDKFIYTIVTPSFNHALFIDETIASVVMQKGDFYIDYIIMDGGSIDDTVNILINWENRINKGDHFIVNNKFFYYNNNYIKCNGISFKWVSKKDNGQVDALKKGFNEGVGNVYAWLNSDDIYINDSALQIVKENFLYDETIKIISSDGIFIDKNGNEFGKHHVYEINIKELIYLDYHILQPSTFFLKTIYNPEDLDESMVCAFDAKFFIKLFLTNKYMKLDNELSAFRFYEDIKTIALSDKRYYESIQISEEYGYNSLYKFVSKFYRFLEIKKKTNFNNIFSKKLFSYIRDISYFIILRKCGR